MDKEELKKAGLKITIPRMKILDILESSELKHMSAEDIYKALLEKEHDIGLATVYRVLTQFESAGLVIRHRFEGGQSIFELDRGEHHDHIICIKCGKVEEFFDASIERSQEEIAKKMKYRMTEHAMYIFGVCQACDA